MKKIFLILFMLFAIVGCQPAFDYSDFSDITITKAADQLKQEESTYYIYIYGSNCGHCAEIKQEVLSAINSLNEDVVYIVKQVNSSSVHPDIQAKYRAYSGKDVVGVGTPSLYKIINGSVRGIYVGGDNVLDELHSLS